MKLKPLSKIALGLVFTLVAWSAQASPFDFTREILGEVFEGGQKTGTYEYVFSYNTNPLDVQAHPDPVDPGYLVTYTPYPLYQNKFQLDLFLYLSANSNAPGNWAVQDIPIISFTVWNDFEFNFSNPDDELLILARGIIAGTTQDISMRFGSDDTGALSSISLNDILTGQSEGIFLPSNGSGIFPGGVANINGLFFANVTSVGPIISNVPIVSTLPLIAIGFPSLYFFNRRRKLTRYSA